VTVFSPQGRLHQIEYAMKAVLQGGAVVGLKSKDHVVICGLMKASDELSGYQKKIFKIDDHIGIGYCGLIADGRLLTKSMRQECLRYKFGKEAPMSGGRLCGIISSRSQRNTQQYGRRPYGVGVIVGSYDGDEPHLYYLCPSGNTYDYLAHAIGARSQSAKTYLEKMYEQFPDCSSDDLVKHALRSLRESVQDKEKGLTVDNCVVCVVGKDTPFHIVAEDKMKAFLAELETLPLVNPVDANVDNNNNNDNNVTNELADGANAPTDDSQMLE
jgi:20S proteasome subunit alpha 6